MIAITQNLESPAFVSLLDPDCASLFRSEDIALPSPAETKLAWQVAGTRGAVKDRLMKDDTVRVVLVAAATESDPLLRDIARNAEHMPGRSWLHLVLVTAGRVTPLLLGQLRRFASWSVLSTPCSSDELTDIMIDAAAKAADQHRLAMLSTAIRAEAEDLLIRTRNIVGALQNAGTPAALGNLVSIADRLTGGTTAPDAPPLPAQTAGAASAAAPARTFGEHSLSELGDSDRSWTRSLIDLCSTRQNYFPDGLFSDPAWDMLLDLTHARLSGKRVSVSSLCIASRVPATTALRRIGDLVSQGLATRVRDESDGRRVFVDLTEDGFTRMLAYIENVRGSFSAGPRMQFRKA